MANFARKIRSFEETVDLISRNILGKANKGGIVKSEVGDFIIEIIRSTSMMESPVSIVDKKNCPNTNLAYNYRNTEYNAYVQIYIPSAIDRSSADLISAYAVSHVYARILTGRGNSRYFNEDDCSNMIFISFVDTYCIAGYNAIDRFYSNFFSAKERTSRMYWDLVRATDRNLSLMRRYYRMYIRKMVDVRFGGYPLRSVHDGFLNDFNECMMTVIMELRGVQIKASLLVEKQNNLIAIGKELNDKYEDNLLAVKYADEFINRAKKDGLTC